MLAHLKYLWYVLRHKWFVFSAGLGTGAPLWRLVVHDWSKFTPAEWSPYVRFFYTDDKDDLAFAGAWLHHQHRNPHHWQHWMLREDDGDLLLLEIPEALVREMVADWMGAGRAITGKWGVASWYVQHADMILLHSTTRALVEALIYEISNGGHYE